MSIPIMLRWLISKGRSQLDKLKEAALAAEKERLEKALLQKEMLQRQAKMQSAVLPTKSRPPPQPPHPPPLPPPPSYPHHHPSSHMSKGQTASNGQTPHLMPSILEESRSIIPGLEEFRNVSDSNSNSHHVNNERILLSPEVDKTFNPSLSTPAVEEKGSGNSQSDINDSPVLSRLLEDNTSVATSIIPMNCKPNAPPITTKRPRKRKSQSEFPGPMPKQRSDSTNDSMERIPNMGCPLETDMGGVMDTPFNPAMTMGMSSMPSPHGHPAHHSMLNHSAVRSQTPGTVIDLTEDNVVGESSLKKLVDSVDSLHKQLPIKDVKTEPDLPMLLYENDAPVGRIPNTIQNSPSSSKNENASTSLEGCFLKGSGEVGRANNYDPVDAGTIPTSSFSKLSSLLLAPSDGPRAMTGKHQHLNSTLPPEKVKNVGDGKLTLGNQTLMQDIKPQVRPNMNVLQKSSSVDFPTTVLENRHNVPCIFDKFDHPKQEQSANMKAKSFENDSTASSEGRVSLKFTLKQQNNVKTLTKQCNSFDESDLHFSKLDRTGTFDFKSDEDEDDNPIMPRHVYSASPTRLQISTNKQKRPAEPVMGVKVEKNKKKDKSSAYSTKRKREKEESRREKKRKKNEYITSESVYRTVENEEKSEIPKLKIRVAKKPVSDKNDKSDFSDFSEQSYEISKKLSESPRDCKTSQHSESFSDNKVLPSKPIVEDIPIPVIDLVKEKDSGSDSPGINPKPSVQKLSLKSGSSRVLSGNSVNSKTDPKLVTKATIRLKPLTMPNSGTTVSVSQSAPKSAGTTTSGNLKIDKRNNSSGSVMNEKRVTGQNSTLDRRASLSGIHERRNSHQSSLSSAATLSLSSPVTTSAEISLSSILPDAPTVSKIASMPRIPKRSSSSNAPINRTSSLDPVSGTNSSPPGSKSNNSYTAGRHNTVSPSGPGPGGGRGNFGNNSLSFNNYNNRMAPPGNWNNRPNLPFNANRPGGPPFRQTSPMGNNSVRPQGHRQPGSHGNMYSNSQKSAKPNATPNSILKINNGSSNFNMNTNTTQKPFAGGAKVNNTINPHSKAGHVNSSNSNMKPSQASSNSSNVQRFSGSHSHSNVNSVRPQSSVTKSPNTTGVNQSPNACHSPNVSGSNRSPSLNSAGKSPNISGSSKSPNLTRSPSMTSSPTILNRSPNINNTNRSPNVQTGSGRTSSSMGTAPSRKSPLTVPVKNVSGAPKNSPVLKTPPPSSSSPFSSSSQKLSAPSNTTKPSILKNAIRSQNEVFTVSSSHNVQTVSSPSVNQTQKSKSVPPPGNSQASFEKKGPIPVTTSLHQSSAQSPPVTVMSSSAQSSSLQSVSSNAMCSVNSVSSNSKDVLGGGKKSESLTVTTCTLSSPIVTSSVSVQESSMAFTPAVSPSVDGKSKVTIPSVRGRKNSLSAIVDKLKHNAVGGSSDPSLSLISKSSNSPSVPSENKEVCSRKLSQAEDNSSPLEKQNSSDSSGLPPQNVNSLTKCIPLENSEPSTKVVSCSKDKSESSSKAFSHGTKDMEKISPCLNSSKSPERNEESSSLHNEEKSSKALVFEDVQSFSESVKPKPKPLIISSTPVVSPCSNPFPSQPSPLSYSRTPSPSVGTPKSNGETLTPAQSKDRVFKIPSVRELEERTSSPDIGKPVDQGNKGSKINDSQQHSAPLSLANVNTKVLNIQVDRKVSKSVESPLSDISSPDNDLVIDDESPKSSLKVISKNCQLNSSKNSCSSPVLKSPMNALSSKVGDVASRSTPPMLGERIPPSSPVLSADSMVSPTQPSSRPSSALSSKSPACPRTHSGASTPKSSDSPCDIDDDLMNVALGCDS